MFSTFKYSMAARIIQLTSVYLQSGIFCIIVDALIKLEIYSDYVQEHLAPSGYLKIPTVSIMYLLSIFLIMRNALFMLFG